MNGFFQASTVAAKAPVRSRIPKCGACGLMLQCESPKMPVTGEGRLGVLIVAEAPGEEEDERGTQLIGAAGRYLRSCLDGINIDLDRDCWKTNALICRPPENRTPTNDEIDYCRPNLMNTIRDLRPRVIIPLGAVAVRSLLGSLWREDVGPIGTWVGWKIPLQKGNTWVVPNYHPSYVLRSKEDQYGPAVKVWFERYLQEAFELKGRPWEQKPDYESKIQLIVDEGEAVANIEAIREMGCAIAFDYETTKLKPEGDDAEIVCCSICASGGLTIAYPWTPSTAIATGELLHSDCPKIGANNKFEDRWTRAKLGFSVENWVWDTMLDAHILDNRDGVTSVKFQAFIRLGFPPWDDHIKPYLIGEKGGVNRIREMDMRSLLYYCGLDSLVEYKLAEIQRKEMMHETR